MHIRRLELVLFLLILGGGLFFFSQHSVAERLESKKTLIAKTFPDITLQAKAAFVWDVKAQKMLYGLDERQSMPLASITKVMTALVAHETLPKETIITITKHDLSPEGDSGLLVGERWELKDLIEFSLIVSSNDGSHALAAAKAGTGASREEADDAVAVFIEAMNQKARDIGMTESKFYNETGLDVDNEIAGGYASARDVSIMFAYMIKNYPEVIEATSYPSMTFVSLDDKSHFAKNTDTAIGRIPSLIASKTGFTDLAGGNLAIAFDAGVDRPIVVTVLGSTVSERFEDITKLANATLEALQNPQRINKEGGIIKE